MTFQDDQVEALVLTLPYNFRSIKLEFPSQKNTFYLSKFATRKITAVGSLFITPFYTHLTLLPQVRAAGELPGNGSCAQQALAEAAEGRSQTTLPTP